MEASTPRKRGPNKQPRMVHITMRVPGFVLEHFDNSVRKLRDALVQHVKEQTQWPQPPKEP
jgi:hypothetical protein